MDEPDLFEIGPPMGLHAFELVSPCHRIVLALLEPSEKLGVRLSVQCVLREDIRLLGGAALITIRVQRSQGNSS
jgi:hypothetical protein